MNNSYRRRVVHGLLLLLVVLLYFAQALVEEGTDWLILCTADGKLFTVHAWTGSVQTDHVVHTDPLIGRSITKAVSEHDNEMTEMEVLQSSDDEDSSNIILPGLDGRLYWQQEDGSLQALQLEISSLLEQPVKSCQDENERDCGILTATVETSLLALNAQGQVQWYDTKDQQRQFFSSDLDKNGDKVSDDEPFLLLQRRDYSVKHVRTTTGTQAWNISLGTWQALDFGSSSVSEDDTISMQELPGHAKDKRDPLLATDHPLTMHISLNVPTLPAVVFTNHGRTLIAVDLISTRVLWTMDTPSTVASVFGMQRGQWKPVQVLQEQDLMRAAKPDPPPQLAITDHGANDHEEETQKFMAYALQDWFSSSSRFAQQHRQKESATNPLDRIAGTKPKFPRRNTETNVCMPGDDCRNIPATRQFLQLPLPPPRVQPEGLYLSWALVGGLLLAFIVIAGFAGHLWYLRKKRKWIEDMNAHKEIMQSAIDRSLVSTETLFTEPLTTFQTSKDNSEQPDPSEEEKDIDNKSTVPVTMTAIGGIPLVRYSRYAMEFEELEPLGKGGFGTVWRVRNLFDGREYAMKKVQIQGTVGDPMFHQRLERTLREVKILAALDHPNIVRYFNAWLELEKETGEEKQTTDDGYGGESSMGMTKCYSSSILSDSVSQWPSLHGGGGRPSHNGLSSWRRKEMKGVSWRPHALDDASDYLIFESQSRDTEKEIKTDFPQVAGDPVVHDDAPAHQSQPADSFLPPAETMSVASSSSERVRHTLYIQMQLCTQKTIGDLLINMPARKGNSSTGIDIPHALKLFQQIAMAVTYVHAKGLIHRDLKPANCFVDELGNVQVGDFGLSRESSGSVNKSGSFQRSPSMGDSVDTAMNQDHTAGVGTRSYASPEQMNGSDYQSSTDIYSLGVILFELLYPMHTGMERNICLTRLRSGMFPVDFDNLVGDAFPSISPLLLSMLADKPSQRPTASSIASHIKSVLSEYTIMSLDESQHQGPDMLLLRVEAEHCADALTLTIDAIHAAAQDLDEPVEVVQYGLRSSGDGDRPAAIIELAIKFKDGDGSLLVSKLQKQPSIYSARQVRPRSESTLSN